MYSYFLSFKVFGFFMVLRCMLIIFVNILIFKQREINLTVITEQYTYMMTSIIF